MLAILLLLMETKSDDEFKRFVENLSAENIEDLMIEAEIFINTFKQDFNNRCIYNDECCLFALLQKKLSAIAKNKETKFAILQAKLKKEIENNIELQKALEELFNNLQIDFKQPENNNNNIDR